jgi:hypothetical protein
MALLLLFVFATAEDENSNPARIRERMINGCIISSLLPSGIFRFIDVV